MILSLPRSPWNCKRELQLPSLTILSGVESQQGAWDAVNGDHDDRYGHYGSVCAEKEEKVTFEDRERERETQRESGAHEMIFRTLGQQFGVVPTDITASARRNQRLFVGGLRREIKIVGTLPS